MAEEMDFQDVVVEGDALTLIRKLKSSREANHVAHRMARAGRHYESPQYWIEEAPIAVVELIDCERRRDVNDR